MAESVKHPQRLFINQQIDMSMCSDGKSAVEDLGYISVNAQLDYKVGVFGLATSESNSLQDQKNPGWEKFLKAADATIKRFCTKDHSTRKAFPG